MLAELRFGEVAGSAVLVLFHTGSSTTVLQRDGLVTTANVTMLSTGKAYDIYCLLHQVIYLRNELTDFQLLVKNVLKDVAKDLQTPKFTQGYELRVYLMPVLYLFQRRRRLLNQELAYCLGDVLGLYYCKAEELMDYWADVTPALNYLSEHYNEFARMVLQRAAELSLSDSLLRLGVSLGPRLLEIRLLALRSLFSQANARILCLMLIDIGSPEALQAADNFADEEIQMKIVRMALELQPSKEQNTLLCQILHKHPISLQNFSLQTLLDSPLRYSAGPLFINLLKSTDELQIQTKDKVFLATKRTLRRLIQAKLWKQVLCLVKAKGPSCLEPHVQQLLEAQAPNSVLEQVTCRGKLLRAAKRINAAHASVLRRVTLLQQCMAKQKASDQISSILATLSLQALRLSCLWLHKRTQIGRLPLPLLRLCFEYLALRAIDASD